jgi:hypothetical protein
MSIKNKPGDDVAGVINDIYERGGRLTEMLLEMNGEQLRSVLSALQALKEEQDRVLDVLEAANQEEGDAKA